jgi:hypothetical protein
MSKSKIVGIVALIAFTMGILLVGDVVAGEKFKCRIVWYVTKNEQINVGDETGHVVALREAKGIVSNIQGKTFGEGWVALNTALVDISPKTGATGSGYLTWADKDGDKIYMKWDLKPPGPHPLTFFKGTGKFEGVQGKATFSLLYTRDPMQFYADWEGEVELPR